MDTADSDTALELEPEAVADPVLVTLALADPDGGAVGVPELLALKDAVAVVVGAAVSLAEGDADPDPELEPDCVRDSGGLLVGVGVAEADAEELADGD